MFDPARLNRCRCFRVGRSLGTTLYAQWGAQPAADDDFLALFVSPTAALVVMKAMNRSGLPHGWHSIGQLIYPSPLPMSLDGAIGFAPDPRVARYVADLASGISAPL